MKLPLKIIKWSLWGCFCLLNIGQAQPTLAQEITPAENDTNTTVTQDNNNYIIEGGTTSDNGENLFHSFTEFNLNTEQIATFQSNPEIVNIFSRVTGGNSSSINGSIEVSNDSSNLFLMNPAGIVFGNNASLNVGGDFTATTATGIDFDNGRFNASGENNYTDLGGAPTAFVFENANPGAIVNAADLTTQGNIVLVGGNVLNTGNINTSGNQVIIQSVPGENLVRISSEGSLLSLEIDANQIPENSQGEVVITPESLPELLTGREEETGLRITETEQIEVIEKSVTVSQEPDSVLIAGSIDTSGSTAGNIDIQSNNLNVVDSQNSASSQFNAGGDINFTTQANIFGDLSLTGEEINTSDLVANPENISNISLQAEKDINTGNITTLGGSLNIVSNDGSIFTGDLNTSGDTGGNIALRANDIISTGAIDSIGSQGDGGDVSLEAEEILPPESMNTQGSSGNHGILNIGNQLSEGDSSTTNEIAVNASGVSSSSGSSDDINNDGNGVTVVEEDSSLTDNNDTVSDNGNGVTVIEEDNSLTDDNDTVSDNGNGVTVIEEDSSLTDDNDTVSDNGNDVTVVEEDNSLTDDNDTVSDNGNDVTVVEEDSSLTDDNDTVADNGNEVAVVEEDNSLTDDNDTVADNENGVTVVEEDGSDPNPEVDLEETTTNSELESPEVNSEENIEVSNNSDSNQTDTQEPQSSQENNVTVDESTSTTESESTDESSENTFEDSVALQGNQNVSNIAGVTTLTREIEGRFTNTIADHLGINNFQPLLDPVGESIEILNNIEARTNTKSALLYVSFINPNKSWQEKSAQDQLELSLVTASGAEIRHIVEGVTREKVVKEAQKLAKIIKDPDNKNYLTSAQKLYSWLITPLEKELQFRKINNIAFIMDEGLRSAPIAAFHDSKQFIIEKYSVGLMPSLSLTNTEYVDLRETDLLAMGAEKFADQNLLANISLPAVPLELSTITDKLWAGASWSYLNEEFTLKNLKRARDLRPFGIVHLATHGEFRPGKPSNSYIQLWDTRLTLDELRSLKWDEPKLELLVLSACHTAIGDKDAELGFAGLAVLAGARSAMGSLWYVDDAGTLGLMTTFYEQLKEAPVKAEALRRAQLEMLRKNVRLEDGQLITSAGENIILPESMEHITGKDLSHPYYWAAFTMIGNPW